MIAVLADENFNRHILTGLRRRMAIDAMTVQDAGLTAASDPAVLAFAAEAGRVLLTHDWQTMRDAAWARVADGMSMPGVIHVPRRLGVRASIAELELILAVGTPNDFASRVIRLPI